jgi:hypothetical protein
MQIPSLTLDDLSLLLALGAIVLLITSELASTNYAPIFLRINRKKLRNAALITGLMFLATVAIRIINLIINY